MSLGKEVGLGPGHIVLDGDPALTAAPPHFRPMPIVTKRSPISAAAELLFDFLRWRPPPSNLKFLTAERLKRAELHRRAKFG